MISTKCKEFTEKIDLKMKPETFHQKLSYIMHIVLCDVCREYVKMSQTLGRAIRFVSEINASKQNMNIEKLNKDLLEKYKKL
jgi:hypothetical protein